MASLTFGWVQLAAIVGALQGLFLTGILLAQRDNRTANRLLAALMATFTIYLAWGPYYQAGVIRIYPHLFLVSYLTPWVFGPLVYLYARAASDRAWRFTRGELVHFVLVSIVLILAAPVYAMSGAEKIALWDQWSAHGLTPPLKTIDPLKYASGIAYSAATVVYLRGHRRDVEQSYSNITHVRLRWLLWLSAATGGIWLLATGLKLSNVSTNLRDGHITFAMALLVYGIGYMGLRQPEIFRQVEGPEESSPQYERSGLADDQAKQLETALLALMDRESPWKDSDLTLPDLATRLDCSPQKLSQLLNARLGQTFYDFVNGYRVREVQRRIAAGEARSLKMLALALDAGFASKSTFNEAFKRLTKQTPSSFRQAIEA